MLVMEVATRDNRYPLRMLPALALIATVSATAAVVDRIEVVVEEELVMTSDLLVDAVLDPIDQSPSPLWNTTPRDRLARMVEATLIRTLAGEIGIYQPDEADVERRMQQMVNEHFANKAAWSEHLSRQGLDEAAVRTALRRRVVVERWLNRNLQAPPDDRLNWWREYRQLIAQQSSRARIRHVDPRQP